MSQVRPYEGLPFATRGPEEGPDLERPDAQEQLKAWARELGPMYAFHQPHRVVVVISDHRVSAEVLRARPGTFRRMASIESVCKDMGIHSVFSAEGQEWEAQGRLLMNSFRPAALRRFHPTMLELVGGLRERWTEAAATGEAVDVQQDLMLLALEVITRFALGYSVADPQEGAAIHAHLQTILAELSRRVHCPKARWRPAPDAELPELAAALADVHGRLREAIAQARARVGTSPPVTYLDAMLRAPGGSIVYDDERLAGNAMIMLLAGEDAVANVMTWMLDALCRHEEVAAALREEVDAALGDRGAPSYDQLEEIPYLGALIDEVCRLRPADESLFMETLRETEVGGYTLPGGTPLFLLIRPPMAHPDHFAEPERFDPRRWLPHQGCPRSGPHDRSAYMPFGLGPRYCPGRGLAYHQARVVAAMVARHFTVSFAGDDGVPVEEWGFIMAPRGLRVRFTCRDEEPRA